MWRRSDACVEPGGAYVETRPRDVDEAVCVRASTRRVHVWTRRRICGRGGACGDKVDARVNKAMHTFEAVDVETKRCMK